MKSPALNPVPLDTKSESNRADICDYLRRELAMQLQIRPDADRLVDQILERSEGVFLYVERFCDDIQGGHLSLDRPEQFPQGLGGIFFQYFHRQFPDLEKFRQDVRPALRAILAAREPLPVEILRRLFNWQDEELRDFTRCLGSLFPVTKEANNEVIKPYHKSLADWLGDEAKAGAYFVSMKEGHRILASEGQSQLIANPDVLPSYFIQYLLVHLRMAEMWTGFRSAFGSASYLEKVIQYIALRSSTHTLEGELCRFLRAILENVSKSEIDQCSKLMRATADLQGFAFCIRYSFCNTTSHWDNFDPKATCHSCNNSSIIRGTIDLGGLNFHDYYWAWCTECYWFWHDDYWQMYGYEEAQWKYDYASNTYSPEK